MLAIYPTPAGDNKETPDMFGKRQKSEGNVILREWDLTSSEFDNVLRKSVERALDKQLRESPPSVLLKVGEKDVDFLFSIDEFSDAAKTLGPTWKFSLSRMLLDECECYGNEVANPIVTTLRNLADKIERKYK